MLNIDIEPVRGILFVRLSGKLIKNNIKKFYDELFTFLEVIGVKNIVFNLSKLKDIDGYGKNAIIHSFIMCMKNKGESLICVGDNKKLLSIFKNLPDKIVSDELSAEKIINY